MGIFEARRIRRSGPDAISVFVVLFLVQCCLPGIVIYACLPLVDRDSPTDVMAFDRIYGAADVPAALLVLGLTAWFIFFFYTFAALGDRLLRHLAPHSANASRLVVAGSPARLLMVLVFGFALTAVSFYTIGSSLSERFTHLILFRAGLRKDETSLLNAFGFVLTQTWAWLSVPALFVIYERLGRRRAWYLALGFLLVFMVTGVSRRALFIPPLLCYLSLVVFDRRWRAKWVLLSAIPVLLWIAFGKELLGVVAFHRTWSDVATRYDSLAASFLRAASEIGLTVVESLGSIQLLDLPPRFGIDHLLSTMRQIPTSHYWLGQLPMRMARLSTEAFASASDEDIPPGIFGQMWLDLRVFGPVAWGLVLGLQMSIAQHVFAQCVRTRQAVALLVLATFVIALPLNTGSYDFTFGMDIYALLLCILLTFRFIRVRVPAMSAHAVSAARG